jgi:hypothetical protein
MGNKQQLARDNKSVAEDNSRPFLGDLFAFLLLFICRLNASFPSFLTQFQIQNKYFATLLLSTLPFWRFTQVFCSFKN